jgi:hypothetical protein
MHQGNRLDKELGSGQGGEGRAELQIPLTGVASHDALLVFCACDLGRAQDIKIPGGTEGTEEAMDFSGAAYS